MTAARRGTAGPVRRVVIVWLAYPLMSLTLRAWGRRWISTPMAGRLNTFWTRMALLGHREGQ